MGIGSHVFDVNNDHLGYVGRAFLPNLREGCKVRRDAILGFAAEEAADIGRGFVVTLEWSIHLVMPVPPGNVGYLPVWPWQVVASPLTHPLFPAAIFLVPGRHSQ